MSFLGINIAGSALETFQTAENVTSQNIANVDTPGASRQIINIGQLPPIDGNTMYPNSFSPGTQGTGVYISSIQRVHQDSYDALFRGATASSNFFSTEQSVLQGLQSSFGEPTNGVNTALTAFQTALQTLVNNPQGTAERTGVLNAAQGLVTTLNTAGSALQSSAVSVQGQATSVVNTINTTIDQIAALNGQIRAATAVGDSPNTYEDQRDQLIDTLSTYVSTSTSVQADGSTLVTVDGHALVNDTVAYHLAAPVIGTAANGTTSLVVGFTNDPNPSNPTPIDIGGGSLGALLDVYNNKITPYTQELNNFANGLATEADKITEAGYDLTGQPGGQLFSPVVSQLPISAGNIQVGIATASEIPASDASTASGTLVQPLNAANATVDTTVALTNNTALANPPAAAMTGSLTVTDDGINQTYQYSTATDNSTLASNAAAGSNTITVTDASSFNVGDKIVIGTGTDQETVTVAAVNTTTNVVTLTTALVNAHQQGENAGGNAATIGGFINSFNAEHFGVTASYNSTSQSIVFTRDPNNIDLVHRAAMQAAGGSTTPSFTITDSNAATATIPAAGSVPPATPAAGSAAQPGFAVTSTSLLAALGANQINGIQQNATNAFGSTAGTGANALLSLFSASYGVPGIQTTSATAVAAPGLVTITPTAGQPGFSQLDVGSVLTIDAGTANQENVTVTAVNRTTGSISFIAKNTHLAGFSITSAQTATLQQSYTSLVSQMGLDTSTAISGASSQATLTSNVNAVRQSTDGINIDEETQNLVKFQNAYGAAAHVISVLASMLDDAINLGTGSTF